MATSIERKADTAADAERGLYELMRLCGRAGKVVVWSREGRMINPRRLAALARLEEQNAS
jgi:hypothetical protein